MSDTTIKVMDNGPLAVKGQVTLIDGEGNKIETKASFFLCRCGLSGHQSLRTLLVEYHQPGRLSSARETANFIAQD